jgi:hypothetical protein
MNMRALTLALLLTLPAAVPAAEKGAYYFIAVQNGAYNFKGGEEQMAESYKALQAMVKLAGEQNVRLTLLFSAQYAVYIASDPARMAELQAWKEAGHEVGAYHQGPDTRAWDGYTDLRGPELARVRKDGASGAPVGGHAEYLAALARLEPAIKTSCTADKYDAAFRAAAPPYEICRGGREGRGPGAGGINEFIAVSASDTAKKGLSSFHPADRAGIEAAGKIFSAMPSGVYGTVFKSSPSEFGAFYAWLAYLRRADPLAGRSRTVTTTVNGDLLKEKEEPKETPGPLRAAKKENRAALPQPAVQAEPARREIPHLKPVRSLYGTVGRVMFGRQRPANSGGYCGDGICDAAERSHPGRCPRDCGR